MAEFVKQTRINAPAARVFSWHERPDALRRLIPPWESVSVVKHPASLEDGATAVLRLRVGPVRMRWIARHRDYCNRGEQGGEFTDVQVYGPFKAWEHTHIVRAEGHDACILEDRIRYELPLGPVGKLLAHRVTRRRLKKMLDYRHRLIRTEVEAA